MTVLHTSNGPEIVSCIADALLLIDPVIADYIVGELGKLSADAESVAEELSEIREDYEGLSEDYHNVLCDIMEEAEAGLTLTDAKRLDRSEVREVFRNVKHLCYVNL